MQSAASSIDNRFSNTIDTFKNPVNAQNMYKMYSFLLHR